MATAIQFEKDFAQVWCHSGPNTPYELAYWRSTFQSAWNNLHKPVNKPVSAVYQITNKKAIAALHCDKCRKHAAYAVYSTLSLYCDEHAPEGVNRQE